MSTCCPTLIGGEDLHGDGGSAHFCFTIVHTKQPNGLRTTASVMSDNSTATADPCAASADGEYDRSLHIAAIFIIMGTSFMGTLLPILGKSFVKSAAGGIIITLLKLFGAGVIMATAFVHMLVPAGQTLTNTCLPSIFIKYSSFSAVFALAGVFLTHIIQVLAGESIRNQQHRAEIIDPQATKHVDPSVVERAHSNNDHNHGDIASHEGHTHGGVLLHSREMQLIVYMLELGIASHSIIIGLTLGIATDEFKTLLVALVFHQFFEGIALSAIVMEADFKKWTMAVGM
eukprot:jgi/Hompol1/3406/HPOL_006517-RA